MHFKAPIGYYPEEKRNGNDIVIDLKVKTNLTKAGKTDLLENTIDYQKLYDLVAEIVTKPADLLESVAYKISKAILAHFSNIKKVKLRISKLNPPIKGNCSSSQVIISHKQKTKIRNQKQSFEPPNEHLK